jgi:ribokinase
MMATARPKPELVVVGSHSPALVLQVERVPRAGETVNGWDYQEPVDGGKGSNQAIAAARLGAKVSFVGCVGEDRLGQAGTRYLTEAGVDITWLKRSPAATVGGFVMVGPDGVPAIVAVLGANGDLTLQDVEQALGEMATPRLLLTQCEIRPPVALHAARLARARGWLTIINPAPAPDTGLLGLDQADVLTPNETEALALLGRPLDDRCPGAQLAAELRSRSGARNVIVTLGAKGLAGCDAEGAWETAAPKARATDTTGAGDAFNGALVVALLRGQPLRAAAAWACLVATYSASQPGTIPNYPTRQQVAEFARQVGWPIASV